MGKHTELRLERAEDEDDRDMIYEDIYEVAEVCGHLSVDIVSRYNNHARLVEALREAEAVLEAAGEFKASDKIAALLAQLDGELG